MASRARIFGLPAQRMNLLRYCAFELDAELHCPAHEVFCGKVRTDHAWIVKVACLLGKRAALTRIQLAQNDRNPRLWTAHWPAAPSDHQRISGGASRAMRSRIARMRLCRASLCSSAAMWYAANSRGCI